MDTMFETVETVDFPKKDTEVANYGMDDSSIVGTAGTIEQNVVVLEADF